MSQACQVILLAGGAGTRLAPMTSDLPKPLLPIAGEPVLSGLFSLLQAHGFSEAKLAVHYRAEDIRAYYGDHFAGLALSYHCEDTPLGTAGCVAAAASGDGRPVLVLSGDGVLEADLSALLALHEAKGAAVTMLLARRDDPSEYGVVLCDDDGRIRTFLEKPGRAQAYADTVNTGVYVLSPQVVARIPQDTFFDFARDLFPLLLAQGVPMYGCVTDAFWCDMGDIDSYRACNFRAAQTDNVVGAHCRVADSAHLQHCILHTGVTIGERSVLRDAILCRGVTVGVGVTIGTGAVIGADAMLADGASVAAGVHLARGVHVPPGAEITADSVGGAPALRQVSAYGIHLTGGQLAEALTHAARAIAGLASQVGVMASSDENGRVARLLIEDMTFFGAEVLVFDADSEAVAAALARAYRLPLTLHIKADTQGCHITLLDADGLVPDRPFERALVAAFAYPKPVERAGAQIRVRASGLLYAGMLDRLCRPLAPLALTVTDAPEARHLCHVLAKNGASLTTDAPLVLTLTEGGKGLVAAEGEVHFDTWHLFAILLSRLPSGMQVALPHTAPFSLTQIAQHAGVTLQRYAAVPFDRSEAEVRRLVGDTLFFCDGSGLAVALCSLLAATKASLSTLAAGLPAFVQLRTHYPMSIPSAAMLAQFGLPAGDGVIRFPKSGCSVRLIPHASGFSLYTEAATTEVASAVATEAEQEIFAALSHKEADTGQHFSRKDGAL